MSRLGIPAAIYHSPSEKKNSTECPTSVSIPVISRWCLCRVPSGLRPGCGMWIQCLLINKASLHHVAASILAILGTIQRCVPLFRLVPIDPPNLINLNSVSALPRGRRSTPALHLPHSSSSPQSGTNSLEKSACVRLCNHRFPQAQFCLRWWGVFFIWNESTSGTHLTWFGKSCVSDPENKTKKFCENKPDFFFLFGADWFYFC